MNKIFTEFENESTLRTYPFASGCTTKDTNGNKIGTGILIDAALYPVNPNGVVYLSSILADGTVNISDEKSVIMTATFENGSSNLEFYDTTGLRRHVGTLVASSAEALSTLVNVYDDRTFRKSETAFASSCVFTIVNDGVTSIQVNTTGSYDGEVVFENENDDPIRVSTDGSTLRFDVIPPISVVEQTSIQHIYCIVDGKTPFRIQKIPFSLNPGDPNYGLGNTVAVYLDNIERQDVCSNAHREDALEVADTCKDCETGSSCHVDPTPPDEIPDTYQVEVVDIPHGADSAFYLAVPNFMGYDNPLSITLTDGASAPKTEIKIDANADNLSNLTDNITSKGAVLQVPGLQPSL